MQKLFAQVRGATDSSTHKDTTPRLTVREEEVLRLITYGKSNKEIASDLRISPRTAKFHMTNLLRKFGVTTRLEMLSLLSRF